MANTYTLIQAQTLSTTAASVTFSAIPSTYTDLKLVTSLRSTVTNQGNVLVTFNGSSSSLSAIVLYTFSNAAYSYSDTNAFGALQNPSNATANTFASGDLYICGYASSNYKSMSTDTVTENNGNAQQIIASSLWSNTAAITSLTMTPQGGTGSIESGSSFYLYGIKNS
jgi:hypothetical protein